MNSLSDAALLIVHADLDTTAEELERVMRRSRYRAQETPVPQGYPLALDERLSFGLGRRDGLVVVRTPVDAVFRIAGWWSREQPETPLAAVRCYRDSDPCLKFFLAGSPLWRVGPDQDYEVDFDVPTRRPFDAFEPAEAGLPETASGAIEVLRRMAPELESCWLRRDSRLS